MFGSRSRSFIIFAVILGVLASVPNSSFALRGQATSTDRSQGIALYESGDMVGAIKTLKLATKRDKNDVVAWHYLGLAFERQNKTGDGRKAHEKAARLGDYLLEVYFSKIGSADSKLLFEQIREPLSEAADSARKFLALNPGLSKKKREDWNDRVGYLHEFAELYKNNGDQSERRIFSGKEVTTKARVLSKPEPTYTVEARKNQVTGTVVLRAIFAADGKVRSIFPVRTLPDGRTRQAIIAARQIRFVPATKDGQPVSTFMQLEYSFNLY
jgi:tetratricopeptide (TPR) repeat protein